MKLSLPNKTRPKDNQDAFNRVWTHFIVNKAPRCKMIRSKATCRYRYRYRGQGCAIGCMLPDNLAILADKQPPCSIMIGDVLGDISGIAAWLTNVDLKVLANLQRIHDYYFYRIEDELLRVADEFKLTIPA